MTTEEQRLSKWLHEQTPHPPTSIDLTAVLDRSREHVVGARRPLRRWAPLLAAAAAIAVLATALTALPGHGHDSTPATPSPTPTGRPSTPTPAPTSTPDALTFRPWHARLIVSDDKISQELTAIGPFLYAFRGESDLARINPETGAVDARQPVAGDTSSTVAGAANRVWTVAPTDAHLVTLTAHDALSLRALARYSFAVTGQEINGPDDGPALATRGATLYVGEGNRVLVVDASTGRLTSTFEVADGVISVSATPDGSRIVVASGGHSDRGVIEVLDARDGHALSRRVVYGCGSVLAVQRGYYATCGQGTEDEVGFTPFRGSPVSGGGPGVQGGGGTPATAQISDGVVWLGGPQEAACVDSRTQRVRAHVTLYTQLPGGPAVQGGAALSGMSVVHGRLYAIYIGLNNTSGVGGLVELTPPKACGLR